MQGIEFEEEGNAGEFSARKTPFLLGLLRKIGIANEATANVILIAFSTVFIGYAVYIYAGLLGKNVPSKQDAEQIAAHMKMMQEAQSIK